MDWRKDIEDAHEVASNAKSSADDLRAALAKLAMRFEQYAICTDDAKPLAAAINAMIEQRLDT